MIPCYNEAATLEQVIDKVLGAPVANLEVIVVDDGST
ncbi:MAG TPA: glycosyltransferase, partial [Myxococcota bacterium]|nr:glycosyltransferase [Myxococcota bacterium]